MPPLGALIVGPAAAATMSTGALATTGIAAASAVVGAATSIGSAIASAVEGPTDNRPSASESVNQTAGNIMKSFNEPVTPWGDATGGNVSSTRSFNAPLGSLGSTITGEAKLGEGLAQKYNPGSVGPLAQIPQPGQMTHPVQQQATDLINRVQNLQKAQGVRTMPGMAAPSGVR